MTTTPAGDTALVAAAPVPWAAYACLAGSMAMVGGYVGLSKLLVAVLPVFLLAWLRFGIAAIAMAPWVAARPGEPALDTRTRRLLFVESFFGNFLFSICMLGGVARSSSLAAGVVMAGIPAAVALLSRLLLRETIAPRTLGGIVCAVGGIALVAATRRPASGEASASPVGVLLLVGAVFCEATYVVVGKRLAAAVGPKRISALINLWGLALVTPFGVWQAIGFDFRAVGGPTWALLVGYAIAASVVTVWLWMTGLRRVPASRAGVFTVLLPTSAALIGLVVFGETITPAESAAFVLALAGVLLATWPARAVA